MKDIKPGLSAFFLQCKAMLYGFPETEYLQQSFYRFHQLLPECSLLHLRRRVSRLYQASGEFSNDNYLYIELQVAQYMECYEL